jgi:putative RecB family exonuclease
MLVGTREAAVTQGVLDHPGIHGQVGAPVRGSESYSSLTLYERCPRTYAFRYVERLPGHVPPGRFAFGSAVHRAFEVYVAECLRTAAGGTDRPGLETLLATCDEVLRAVGLEPDELGRLRAAAGPVLGRFLEREAQRDTTPVAAELGFGLDVRLRDGLGSVRFVGYIDRVDRAADGSIVIRDYKTGRTRSQAEVDVDRQLTAYAYAAAQGALRDPASGEPLPPASCLSLYFADEGVEVTTTRTAADLAGFEQDLMEMVTLAREGRFNPRPEPWRCHWCEYREDCPDAVTGD